MRIVVIPEIDRAEILSALPRYVTIVALQIEKERVRADIGAGERNPERLVCIITGLVDQQRNRVVPSERQSGSRVVPQVVRIVPGLIDNRADTIMCTRSLREIHRLVQVVTLPVEHESRSEPVTCSEREVSCFVGVVSMNVRDKAESAGP